MKSDEGTGKAVLGILLAILLAIAIYNWHHTLFVLRFLWDLAVINTHPWIDKAHTFISNHFGSNQTP